MKVINFFTSLIVKQLMLLVFNLICPGLLHFFLKVWQLCDNIEAFPLGVPDPKWWIHRTLYPISTKAFTARSVSSLKIVRHVKREVLLDPCLMKPYAVSPEWPRCCAVIVGRLRIAQTPGEEMSPEEQRQQLRGPSGPATQLLGEADGTCPGLF